MKRQRMFTGSWHPTSPISIEQPGQLELRPTQVDAVQRLTGYKHVILEAVTGWGKTIVIKKSVLAKLTADRSRLAIISIPQTPIAKGWREWADFEMEEWHVGHDLTCRAKNCLDQIITFVTQPRRKSTADRILLCCHATLARFYAWVLEDPRQREKYLERLLVWFDECHHAMNDQVQGRDEVRDNMLGAMVTHCVRMGAEVGLATATFFRTKGKILSDAVLPLFELVEIPIDVHMDEAHPIDGITYDIMCTNLWTGAGTVLREGFERSGRIVPTLALLPKRNSFGDTGDKCEEVEKLIREAAATVGAMGRIQDGAVTILTGGKQIVKLLDLVNPALQKAGKQFLDDEKRFGRRTDMDVIIALGLCGEGFNWPWAEHLIVLGERYSILEMQQNIGRIIRKAAGKSVASIYHIVDTRPADRSKYREYRNRLILGTISALLLEDIYAPSHIRERQQGAGAGNRGSRLSLATICEHDPRRLQKLIVDFCVAVKGILSFQSSLAMMPAVLDRHRIAPALQPAVWRLLWDKIFRAARDDSQGHDIPTTSLNFEFLEETRDASECLMRLITPLIDGVTFKEVREAIKSSTTVAEARVILEREASRNGGSVPPFPQLRAQGLGRIVDLAVDEPGEFWHLKFNKHPANNFEGVAMVAFVTKLAAGNRDRIPAWEDLNNRGLPRVASYISRHRSDFAHLAQDERGRRA